LLGKAAPGFTWLLGSVALLKRLAKEIDGRSQAAAAKAVAEARAKLMQAPLEEVQVPTEAYENAMREITAQSMQFTEAARETGARELAASVGRIGAAGLNATEQQREAMASDIYKRDMTVAQDEARRLGALANLDVMEARGAQLAAAQAAEARGRALTGAVSALGQAAGAGLEATYMAYGRIQRAESFAQKRGLAHGASRGIFGPNGQFSRINF
jgi:hypothetical protein